MSDPPASAEPMEWLVGAEDAGTRLDVFLAHQLTDFSRTFLRKQISGDSVLVDGSRAKVAYRLQEGQRVSVTPLVLPRDAPAPEDIPLHILFEDDHLAVVDKPAGMVVHPAKGHWSGTLASALAFHFGSLSTVGGPTRPGIVHRLDRDTSGVILVAKTDSAHQQLAEQFEARRVEKEYLAIVIGNPDRDRDNVSAPIGPHPYQREKMAVRADLSTARLATTFYEVTERFGRFAVVHVFPKTGRTHQIRLHLAHIGHPVLCDRLYGGRAQILRGELTGEADQTEVLLDRQALHARRLTFFHPVSGDELSVEAPLPGDIEGVLRVLRSVSQ